MGAGIFLIGMIAITELSFYGSIFIAFFTGIWGLIRTRGTLHTPSLILTLLGLNLCMPFVMVVNLMLVSSSNHNAGVLQFDESFVTHAATLLWPLLITLIPFLGVRTADARAASLWLLWTGLTRAVCLILVLVLLWPNGPEANEVFISCIALGVHTWFVISTTIWAIRLLDAQT